MANNISLNVEDLTVHYGTPTGDILAVNGVSFNVEKGEALGLVGESGCGKSVTSLSIMRLIPNPPGFFSGGSIFYKGKDLLKIGEAEMRKVRGNKISMIFQEPMTSLNPVFSVGDQIMETLILHQNLNKGDARNKAIEMLDLVGFPAPDQRIDDYPHQLSGGMRQRVVGAIGISCNPAVLIADEPTTSLDATIQAQYLRLLRELQEDTGVGIIFITHDFGIVAKMCDRVAVMYAGKIVEQGAVREIFDNPLHPYTEALIRSVPKMEENVEIM